MTKKQCSRCKHKFPPEQFWKGQHRCKRCHSEVMKKVRQGWSEQSRTSPTHKFCPKCKTNKSHKEFYKKRDRPDVLAAWCSACDKISQKRYARRKVLRRYDLNEQSYERMLKKTKGRCPICMRPFAGMKRLPAIDHNHQTGEVRGLLCGECNLGLGKFRDDPVILKRALVYLERRELR